MRDWSKTTKRWAGGALVLLVMTMTWAMWPEAKQKEWLEVRFTGFTNWTGWTNKAAVFSITNRSEFELHYCYSLQTTGQILLVEWAGELITLAPQQGCTWTNTALTYALPWQMVVRPWRRMTQWETRQSRWGLFCADHRLPWIGSLVRPRGYFQTITTAVIPPPE